MKLTQKTVVLGKVTKKVYATNDEKAIFAAYYYLSVEQRMELYKHFTCTVDGVKYSVFNQLGWTNYDLVVMPKVM